MKDAPIGKRVKDAPIDAVNMRYVGIRTPGMGRTTYCHAAWLRRRSTACAECLTGEPHTRKLLGLETATGEPCDQARIVDYRHCDSILHPLIEWWPCGPPMLTSRKRKLTATRASATRMRHSR